MIKAIYLLYLSIPKLITAILEMFWIFDVQPKPCPADAVWSTLTFDPIVLFNDIKLELDPTAEEFTPTEKVRSLNPNADVFKPLLAHPFKFNPFAKEFRPATKLNPEAQEFCPSVQEDDVQPTLSELNPNSAEFFPKSTCSQDLTSDIFLTFEQDASAKSLVVTKQQVFSDTNDNILDEVLGENAAQKLERKNKIEYFLCKKEVEIRKLQSQIANKFNFFRRRKLQRKLAEYKEFYDLLHALLNMD